MSYESASCPGGVTTGSMGCAIGLAAPPCFRRASRAALAAIALRRLRSNRRWRFRLRSAAPVRGQPLYGANGHPNTSQRTLGATTP